MREAVLCPFRQLAYFVGNDGKSPAVFACAGLDTLSTGPVAPAAEAYLTIRSLLIKVGAVMVLPP